MRFIIFVIFLFSRAAPAFEYGADEVKEMEEGLQKWQALAANPEAIPTEDRIEKLGVGLRKTAQQNIYVFGDREGVHEQLRNTLLSLGGYGDYYANSIRAAGQAMKDEAGTPGLGIRQGKLRDAQVHGFGTLGLLPSPESIRTIGEFLFDEEGQVSPSPPGQKDDRNRRQRESGRSPNSVYALRAMVNLPLVSPPVPRRIRNHVRYDEDIEAWRLWYEQVKSGKRTFRFEGDPLEYDLRGPVLTASAPAVADRGPANKPRPVPATTAPEDRSRGLPVAALLGSLAILAVALWRVSKRKLGS